MKKSAFIGIGIIFCVFLASCERGTKRIESGDQVVKQVQSDVQQMEFEEFSSDELIRQVEALRDREFGRRPVLVAEKLNRLVVDQQSVVDAENDAGLADRAAIFAGLIGRTWSGNAGLDNGLAALARYDAATGRVMYANGYADRETLRLAIVLALVKGLNAEHFERVGQPTSWDEALALDAAAMGDAMFVATQSALAEAGQAVEVGEVARFPEVALRNEALRGLLDGVSGVLEGGDGVEAKIAGAERGFAAREGYALAAAMYRVSGWSAVEVMKHAPPRSSGYVVRPDRWFSGDDLGTWSWPVELTEGWAAESWHPKVQSGRVGPAVIALWLGQTIDPSAARTVYAGWRSDAYRLHRGQRLSSARRKGAVVFEWVSQWDTPHSAAQVAEAFRLVLDRNQSAREDGARHIVVQNGLNVAVIVTDSDAQPFEETARLVDRAGILSAATVRYGQVQGLPFSFQPTRLEQFLLGAASARLEDDRFEDPASGVRMDLSVLKKNWSVQKTDETSIRWFARLNGQNDGALMQFTTELRDVLGPEFGTSAYQEKIQAAFARSLGVEKVDVRVLDEKVGEFAAGRVLEIRGQGAVGGKPRALWLRQFLVGDILCTLSLQDSPKYLDANLGEVQAVFDGILVGSIAESAKTAGDEMIRIQVED